jgi:hypothetical protein
VGSISRLVVHKRFRIAICGHRFSSKSAEVEAFWTDILGGNMLTQNRLSRIFYGDKFYNYPLEANDVIRNLKRHLFLLSAGSHRNIKSCFPITNPPTWKSGSLTNSAPGSIPTFSSHTQKKPAYESHPLKHGLDDLIKLAVRELWALGTASNEAILDCAVMQKTKAYPI